MLYAVRPRIDILDKLNLNVVNTPIISISIIIYFCFKSATKKAHIVPRKVKL